MAPPSKRVKREKAETRDASLDMDTFIITPPGIKADTRIEIAEYATEFFVCSSILKLHSLWFRKLFENATLNTVGSFKYEICIEYDGKIWKSSMNKENVPNADLTLYELRIPRAFRNIMNSMTHKSIELHDSSDIVILANTAAQFGALPSTNNGMDVAFFTTSGLFEIVSKDPILLLECAYKLRNKNLFRECFILALGPFDSPRYLQLQNPELYERCKAAYEEINARAVAFSLRIFHVLSGASNDIVLQIMSKARSSRAADGNICLAAYVRGCSEISEFQQPTFGDLSNITSEMLENKLVLKKGKALAGTGEFRDFFLCSEIKEFPWDDSEWA